MKKKMIALLAGALLTLGMAGNAMAYFTSSSDDLFRVVYNSSTGVEVATDLGSIATLLAAGPNAVVGGGAASFMGAGRVSSTDLGSAYVAYFAKSTLEGGITGKYIWGSGDPVTPQVSGTSQWNNASGAMANIITQWGTGGTSNQTNATGTSATNSYWHKADGSGSAIGSLGGIISNTTYRGLTEASLANLATAPVTQGLWYFSSANTSQTGALAMTIVTNADGSTTINAQTSSTPIPPSFFLMGSGLLGMVGLRRKMK